MKQSGIAPALDTRRATRDQVVQVVSPRMIVLDVARITRGIVYDSAAFAQEPLEHRPISQAPIVTG